MVMIEPALASHFEAKRLKKGVFAVDTKLDGHRILFDNRSGEIWSRNCKPVSLASMPHLLAAIACLPLGVYDGERIRPGGVSYDVSRIDRPQEFRIVLFDMLADGTEDLLSAPFVERRRRLENAIQLLQTALFGQQLVPISASPLLIRSTNDEAEILAAARLVWNARGEGVVVKDLQSPYRPGKRMLQWLKLKRQSTAVGTLIGFEDGLMGKHSVAVLEDDRGNTVRVKAKDHEWIRKMDEDASGHVGRRVIFEYTERTQYGAYREPRWDRFEDE